jgi:acyl-coenzyme A synthetase/AMP-(fatty) acid ligase
MSDLRGLLAKAAPGAARLHGPDASLALADLAANTGLGAARASLAGRSVLVRTHSQLGAAQALVELDGLARRIVLCPPDLAEAHLPGVIETAGIEAIVADAADPALVALPCPVHVLAEPATPISPGTADQITEWLLFTSGTTGVPKMVIHTLAGLTGAIRPKAAGAAPVVWGTFYDIRRYGGLQILLRALTGGSSMVLSDAHEPAAAHLVRLGALGVTHLSGTPSHWRRALMTPQVAAIAPAYVRLSGEIADQAVLDSLKTAFPAAAIGHAYASTEAGVGFEVDDGLEGFPADYVGRPDAPVEMKVEDGSLRIRSARAAHGYAGAEPPALADADGFVDTGDMVELRGGRWYFAGRRNGVINVGGLKVHPEEVEAVLNDHPAVRMSLVRARKNPITGAVVTADVTLVDPDAATTPEAQKALRDAILSACRAALPPHKAPASVRFVPSLAVTAGGKLDRTHA